MEKEHLILQVHLSGEGTSYPSGAPKWIKEHIILQVHISGEGTSYPSEAPKWRRNILTFRST